jgi:hypothetical protein
MMDRSVEKCKQVIHKIYKLFLLEDRKLIMPFVYLKFKFQLLRGYGYKSKI